MERNVSSFPRGSGGTQGSDADDAALSIPGRGDGPIGCFAKVASPAGCGYQCISKWMPSCKNHVCCFSQLTSDTEVIASAC